MLYTARDESSIGRKRENIRVQLLKGRDRWKRLLPLGEKWKTYWVDAAVGCEVATTISIMDSLKCIQNLCSVRKRIGYGGGKGWGGGGENRTLSVHSYECRIIIVPDHLHLSSRTLQSCILFTMYPHMNLYNRK